MFNQITLIGRLGKDPETSETQGGKTVAKFSVATDSGYGENKKTTWHNVITWEKTADACGKYLRKGSLVAVVGRQENRSYEAKDGGTRYVSEVIAHDVKFLDPKSEGSSGNRTTKRGAEIADSDIPF